MRELALHILDLIENSLHVLATLVRVTVRADAQSDRLEIIVEDNGPGLSISPREAMDPFLRKGKRKGLGLSLFAGTAQRAGGDLTLTRSSLGGLAARACMQLSHVDRSPLGNLGETLGAMACANPETEFIVVLAVGGKTLELSSRRISAELLADDDLAAAGEFRRRVNDFIRQYGPSL